MKKFEYKISYLELVGPLLHGVGIMVIVNDGEETFEGLFWISPDDQKVSDKLVMPSAFLVKEGYDRMTDHPQYDDFIKNTWKVLPGNREFIIKEANK